MKQFVGIGVFAAICGCGYVGDPLPPALNIPQRIADLKAIEAGDRIEIEFTLPKLTTEGLVLKTIGGVDLRAGKAPQPFNADQWAEGAKVIETSSEQPGLVKKTLKAKDWVGQEVVIGVRALNARGRSSGWSNFVVLHIIEPLAKPVLKAAAHPQGVRLEWSGNAPRFRVFRKAPGDQEPVQLSEVNGASELLDQSAEYGVNYLYSVLGLSGAARSDTSDTVVIIPVDTFPPPAPSGLRVIAGVNTVELVWDRVQESDLRGYSIYRSIEQAIEQGPFEKIAELVDVPSFSDKMPAAGRKCFYAVSAVDIRGNESARSVAVETTVP